MNIWRKLCELFMVEAPPEDKPWRNANKGDLEPAWKRAQRDAERAKQAGADKDAHLRGNMSPEFVSGTANTPGEFNARKDMLKKVAQQKGLDKTKQLTATPQKAVGDHILHALKTAGVKGMNHADILKTVWDYYNPGQPFSMKDHQKYRSVMGRLAGLKQSGNFDLELFLKKNGNKGADGRWRFGQIAAVPINVGQEPVGVLTPGATLPVDKDFWDDEKQRATFNVDDLEDDDGEDEKSAYAQPYDPEARERRRQAARDAENRRKANAARLANLKPPGSE
jgi:hypothetical protein